MAERGVMLDEGADEIPAISRVACLIKHRKAVAAWAEVMISEGFEVRVEDVGDGVVEGVAW